MPSLFRFDASAVVHTCSSSHRTPAPLTARRSTAALTTPALDRRSLRWFGISACTATPEDLPPSLAQHGSCRRSSTSSSSLPFRTHVGAENSAVVVDLPLCGPMLSPRVPHHVPIPGPRMERETPGQRPRPNYGHPQARAGDLLDEPAAGELVAWSLDLADGYPPDFTRRVRPDFNVRLYALQAVRGLLAAASPDAHRATARFILLRGAVDPSKKRRSGTRGPWTRRRDGRPYEPSTRRRIWYMTMPKSSRTA